MKKYLHRIRHVHLKDVRLNIRDQVRREGWSFLTAVRSGVFTVPGDGDMDFAPIFDVLTESGYADWGRRGGAGSRQGQSLRVRCQGAQVYC